MEKLVEAIHCFFPDFNMSINDLKNPTHAFVRDFYSRVLIELGVDMDNVRKAQLDQLEYAQDMDFLPILNLMTAINTAFPFLKINLLDMLEPSPKRNSLLMSKVMNFMEFCEARLATDNDEIRKFQEAKGYQSQLIEILEMKTRELNDLACELEACLQEKQDLKVKIESLEIESYENRKNSISLKEAIQMEEENVIGLVKETDILKREISSLNEETEALRSQIVANPDEEKHELDAKVRLKDGVLEKKKELEEKLKEYKENKERMQKQQEIIEKRVVSLIKELEVLRISHETVASAQKGKKELEELQKKKEISLRDLEEICKKIEIENQNLRNKLSLLEKEEETHRASLDGRKSEYSLKSKKYKKHQKSFKEEINAVNLNISNLENDYHDLRSKFLTAKQVVQSQMMEIRQGKHVSDN